MSTEYNSGDSIILDEIYHTAAGRIITAYLSHDELCDLVACHGLPDSSNWKDFKNLGELEKELEALRKKPVSEVRRNGLIGSAVPVMKGERIFGAVGLAIIENSVNANKKDYEAYLIRAAKEMTRRLNF